MIISLTGIEFNCVATCLVPVLPYAADLLSYIP